MGFGEALDEDASEVGHAFAQRLHQGGDQDGGVVIEDVESVPDRAPTEPARGFGDYDRLAVAGGRAHDEKPLTGALDELVEDLGADERGPDVGRCDLGGDERRCADDRARRRAVVIPHWHLPPFGEQMPPIQERPLYQPHESCLTAPCRGGLTTPRGLT